LDKNDGICMSSSCAYDIQYGTNIIVSQDVKVYEEKKNQVDANIFHDYVDTSFYIK